MQNRPPWESINFHMKIAIEKVECKKKKKCSYKKIIRLELIEFNLRIKDSP